MPDVTPGFRFHAEWRITLFTVVMLPLLISLGLWQLHRAEEKAALSATYEARRQQAPADLSGLWDSPVQELAYLPVHLGGRFVPGTYFLLDNQIRNGQFGYEVLSVLQLANDRGSVLVNRGWIAGDPSRQTLPEVPAIDGPVEITGHVYVAPGAAFLLAEQQLGDAWPQRIQAVEMDKLAAAIAKQLADPRVFPFPVRIDAGVPGALEVDWQVVNMTPEKHQAYAVQWFAMAAVLFVFYLLRYSNLLQVLKSLWKQVSK